MITNMITNTTTKDTFTELHPFSEKSGQGRFFFAFHIVC